MIINRIQRIFGASRFRALLLEVFAIFLGISASFAVEEWREGREDQENFERYLQAIYFDVLREEALARRFIARGTQAVAAIDALLNRDIEALPDPELLGYLGRVFTTWNLPRGDGSYRALLAAGIPLPFDDTMQALNAGYELNADARFQLETQIAEHNGLVDQVRSQYSTVSNPEMGIRNKDRSVSAGHRFDQFQYRGIRKLFFRDGQFLPLNQSVRQVRAVLPTPEVRRVLNEELERTLRSMDLTIALTHTSHNIRQAISQRLPEIRLAVHSLSVVGSATPTGWTEVQGLPLEREGADGDWWSGELELGDGMVKFVANGIWGTSWGAPIPWEVVDPLTDDRVYLGDPALVFPRGIAEFDGLNIPVAAGRYRVRFNIHTFEYAFDPLGE